MQAIRFENAGDADVIKLVEEPIPQLRPHDLLVRVRAAGLNRADILQRQGFYGKQPDFGDSVIPGLEIAGEVVDVGTAATGFHLIPDLPEVLLTGREDIWLRYYFSDWCFDPLTIQGEAFETYVKAYRAPGAIRGATEDYRANASDVAQDNGDASVKIACPVMSLWGRDFRLVGEMFDMPRVWAEMASNFVTHAIPECGHLPHEEKPEEINRLLTDFLAGWKG